MYSMRPVAQLFVLRVLAKLLYQIGLPIGGPIPWIGGVERGFLVVVARVFFLDMGQGFNCGVGRHRLGQKVGLQQRIQMRLHLVLGVGAHSGSGVHHQAGIAGHFIARVVQQQLAGEETYRGKPNQENRHQHQIKLKTQAHSTSKTSEVNVTL
jgi:hypothetical protein